MAKKPTYKELEQKVKDFDKKLWETEEKFRNFFNNVEIGMFRTKIDGSEILDMNEKFLNIFGRTREEMQGLPSVICWADPSEREEMVRVLEIEGRLPSYECRLMNKQGEVRTCLASLVLYREQGILEGTILDITELKMTQEAFEFLDSIINTVHEPLITLDQDLRVVTVSRSFYKFFKVTPEETMGQFIYDLGNRQWDIPKLKELLENILPNNITFENYEVEHDFAAIGRRTMVLNARQVEQVLGKEKIILLAIEDITERKKIEAGLEKTRKEMQSIINAMSGREIRMAELKKVIEKLRSQLEELGTKPVADDPLK